MRIVHDAYQIVVICLMCYTQKCTLDPAVLWTPSNDTSRPICSDTLNLMPLAPLYLRTFWRYTNAVIIIIIIIIIM